MWQVRRRIIIYRVSPHTRTHSQTCAQPSDFATFRFILRITRERDKGSGTQTKTKSAAGGRKSARVHVRSRSRREETNQQINLEVSVGPGRTSAVTTHFAALIGDVGLPAGTAEGYTTDAALLPVFCHRTFHFSQRLRSIWGSESLFGHFKRGWCLALHHRVDADDWASAEKRREEKRGRKRRICRQQSDSSNLPLRNTRSFDLSKIIWTRILISKHARSREGAEQNQQILKCVNAAQGSKRRELESRENEPNK